MKKNYITPYADFIYVDPEDCCGITLSEGQSGKTIVNGAADDGTEHTSPTPSTGEDIPTWAASKRGDSWFNDADSDW